MMTDWQLDPVVDLEYAYRVDFRENKLLRGRLTLYIRDGEKTRASQESPDLEGGVARYEHRRYTFTQSGAKRLAERKLARIMKDRARYWKRVEAKRKRREWHA